MEWTPQQAAVLKQTEGTESVIQAVARVNQRNQVSGLSNEETFPGPPKTSPASLRLIQSHAITAPGFSLRSTTLMLHAVQVPLKNSKEK